MEFTRWLNTEHGKKVYRMFCRLARERRDAGKLRCGAAAIVNRLRWDLEVDSKWCGFKVDNNYAPMMARQLVIDDPSFAGFFTFHSDATKSVA